MLQSFPGLSTACVALCDISEKLGSQVGVEAELGEQFIPSLW